ncbi:MAG: hypothetical protein V8T46_07075 [Sutterella seckii]
MYDVLFILLVTGFYTWIANMQTGDPALGGSAIGALILVAITAAGVFVSPPSGLQPSPDGLLGVDSCRGAFLQVPGQRRASLLHEADRFLPITTVVFSSSAFRSARTWKASSASPGASFRWRLPLPRAASSARRRLLK